MYPDIPSPIRGQRKTQAVNKSPGSARTVSLLNRDELALPPFPSCFFSSCPAPICTTVEIPVLPEIRLSLLAEDVILVPGLRHILTSSPILSRSSISWISFGSRSASWYLLFHHHRPHVLSFGFISTQKNGR
jgi:hypothetical protein